MHYGNTHAVQLIHTPCISSRSPLLQAVEQLRVVSLQHNDQVEPPAAAAAEGHKTRCNQLCTVQHNVKQYPARLNEVFLACNTITGSVQVEPPAARVEGVDAEGNDLDRCRLSSDRGAQRTAARAYSSYQRQKGSYS